MIIAVAGLDRPEPVVIDDMAPLETGFPSFAERFHDLQTGG